MLKNYLKIAWRNLKRNKSYSFINITGLAVGMACCLLIFLYVQDELSYDDFHEKAGRIYRVNQEAAPDAGYDRPIAITPNIVGPLLTREFAGVEASVRMLGGGGFVRNGNRTFQQADYFYVDSTFFNIFTFPFLSGDPETALTRPNTVVLTKSAAERYFGDENAIGRTIILNNESELEVTGIIKDVPTNSHFDFDFLVSWVSLKGWYQKEIWSSANFYTYILLRDNVSATALEKEIDQRIAQMEHERAFALMPLTAIHLSTDVAYAIDPTGNMLYVYIFSAIAVLILLIAGINYMNLATARATQRAKEVGVRKAAGAQRRQLAWQFLMESILVSIAGALIALILAVLALPAMNILSGKMLSSQQLFSGFAIAALGGLTVLIGLLAGSYPALLLSGFQPVKVLKGRFGSGGKGGFRRALVIFQFAVSIVLIVGTIIVQSQLNYIQNVNLGLDQERVAVLHLSSDAREDYETIKRAYLQHPDVQSVSVVNQYPSALGWTGYAYINGEPQTFTKGFITDGDAVETLGIQLISGRDFRDRPLQPDSVSNGYRYLLNQTLVQALGWTPKEAIGKQFAMGRRNGRVIGVVADFHIASMREAIEPLAIWYDPAPLRNMLVRFAPGALELGASDALAYMKERWAAIAPAVPFNYSFLDDEFDKMYRSEQRIRSVFSVFAVVAILIACLGLFGLATFAAERRMKEMGIRKVMGANASNLMMLLSKDFLKLVLIGFVIAVPIAWYFMNQWLADFAYRIDIGPGIFLLAGGLALLIALATVSWQSIRAALANPVDSLRSE